MKKNGLDKTSIIMIAIFCVLILGAIAGFVFAAVNPASDDAESDVQTIDVTDIAEENDGMLTVEDILKAVPNAQPGSSYSYFDDDGNIQTVTIPMDIADSKQTVDNSSKFKFTEFTDLSDKFLEVCKAGDVETLYDLYYDNLLEDTRLGMETVPTKAEFDAGLKSDMLTVTGFDEYEYGCVELPPTQSPGSYAAYIYSMANNGKELPIANADIENCVNLVVYINNMYQTNHFMVQIGGYWYFIV